jgi:hypothetical protein
MTTMPSRQATCGVVNFYSAGVATHDSTSGSWTEREKEADPKSFWLGLHRAMVGAFFLFR